MVVYSYLEDYFKPYAQLKPIFMKLLLSLLGCVTAKLPLGDTSVHYVPKAITDQLQSSYN